MMRLSNLIQIFSRLGGVISFLPYLAVAALAGPGDIEDRGREELRDKRVERL